MKEHEDRDMTDIEKPSVIVEEIVTEKLGVLDERDDGEDMMVDVVSSDAVDLDSKVDSVRLVEECIQKETESHDLDLDMDKKEEVAGSGEEDVNHDSVGTNVLTVEKETESHDPKMDTKEEVAGSGEEDVNHDSVGTSVLTVEKESESHEMNMDTKEEVAGFGEEDVNHDSVGTSVLTVEKETESHEMNMDTKEVAGSGEEEDVCHDSVGTSVLTVEKVEVQNCEIGFESKGESQFGEGDVAVVDGKEITERGSTMELNVESVEEGIQKETEIRDLKMDNKEEVRGSGGEDGCHDSLGTSVLTVEKKVEVTVKEEVLKTSIEEHNCEMGSESKGEPQFGGGSKVEQHVESVEECIQKETEIRDLNMDMKEEVAGLGEEDGSRVLAFEKVEVMVIEESLNTSLEVSKDVLKDNVETASGSLVQDSKEPSIFGDDVVVTDNKDLTERGSTEKHVESIEEVGDGDHVTDKKTKKESEILDSSKIEEPLEVDMIVAIKDEAKDGVSMDPSLVSGNNQDSSAELVNLGTDEVAGMTKEESLHPEIEVITHDPQGNASGKTSFVGGESDLIDSDEKSDRGLPKEIMVQPMECDQQVGDEDCIMNEKIGKESEVLDSSKISDPSTTINPGSEDVDVVVVEEDLASKDESQDAVSVDPSLVCVDNRSLSIKVVHSATSEGDVIPQAEDLNQQAEVIAHDSQILEIETGVGDSKSVVDSIDIEETEKGLNAENVEIVEQNLESVQVVNYGDSVMDEKTRKGDEVLDSSKIPESLTAANLGPQEVLTTKIESLSTENSDPQAEVDKVTVFEKAKDLDSISNDTEKNPSLIPDKVPTNLVSTPKPSFKVGESIQRVANQLTGPADGQHVDQLVGPEASPVAEMLSQLHLVAQNPMKAYTFLNTIKPFFHNRRTAVGRPLILKKRKTSNENDSEFEFDDVNDSYWTDRIVQNHPEEQLLQDNHNAVAYEPDKPAKPNRRSNKKRFLFSNHEMGLKEQSELVERRRQNLATEVVMRFPEGIYFPSEIHLNKMFRRFGALMESETEVDRQNGRARVVFKKCCDAEVAHSSAGKFNIFGSINVNYELNYTPLVSYKPLLLSVLQDPMDAS